MPGSPSRILPEKKRPRIRPRTFLHVMAKTLVFMSAMITAGFRAFPGHPGPFDLLDRTASPVHVQADHNLLTIGGEANLTAMIDDPDGPGYIHFEPPQRLFDPLARLGRPRWGTRPARFISPEFERVAARFAEITARLAERAHRRGKIWTIAARYPSLFWGMPPIARLVQEVDTVPAVFDSCAFGSDSTPHSPAMRIPFHEKVISNHTAITHITPRTPKGEERAGRVLMGTPTPPISHPASGSGGLFATL